MNFHGVSEGETGSPLVTAGTGSPGRLDPGRIRQPAGAEGTEAALGEIGGQSEQVVQHSFVGTPVAAVEEAEEVERVDEGTEADTEDAASSFIDVVGLDTPEKGRSERGRVSAVAVGSPAVGPGSPNFVDTAELPDRKLSNPSTLACILCCFL